MSDLNLREEDGTQVISGTSDDLLGVYNTAGDAYTNLGVPTFEPAYGHNFPLFRRSLVPTMQRDPRIRYCLNLLKGPIQALTVFLDDKEAENPQLHETIREQGIQFAFSVKCEDEKAKELILKTLNRFWLNGLQEALLAIDWGHSCSQIMFKKAHAGSGLKVEYDRLKHIHPNNLNPLRNKERRMVGVRIRGIAGSVGGIDIPLYKIFWHVHRKEFNETWGQARLEDAYVPWHEMWTLYGARDIRRTWFFRNSYDGGTMYYPVGKTKNANGDEIENKTLAINMMAQMRTGGFRVFNNRKDSDGKTPEWNYEPPASNVTPQGLMEYPDVLRYEMMEAMGIPPEVVESSGEGFGSAGGRKVPLLVYYSTLTPLVNNVVNDIPKFIIDNLLQVNFGKVPEYSITRVVPLKSVEQPAKSTDPITKPTKPSGS